MNWKEVRSRIFTRSNEIVEGSNCMFYRLMGYKFLDSRLVLYYRDCKEVYDFLVRRVEGKDDVFEVVESRFWTKSYDNYEESLEDMKANEADYDKEKPEVEKIDFSEKQ